MILSELKQLWQITKKAIVIIGVLLSFFAVMELIRAYQSLAQLHWILGYAFLVLLLGLLCWCIWYFYSAVRLLPRSLTPPKGNNAVRYGKYLCKYLDRLTENELLAEDMVELLRSGREQINAALARKNTGEIEAVIQKIEKEKMTPAMKYLDAQAEQKIRAGVRDIMFAVTLSPYRSVDLLVVIFRNMDMVKNIALVYKSRPGLRESLLILYDTARVVAAVNFVNLGGKMLENLTKGLPGIIPGVSRIIDDCTQGLAAGLLTSITGHAAKDRCRAYRQWDFEQAKQNIATHLKTFSSDVGKMFFKDIIPKMRIPGGVSIDKWREMKNHISQGFNDTMEALQNFIRSQRNQ